jgi:hypothetical protein
MQPTPLAASEIAAILRAGFSYNDIATWLGGAADGQLVRLPPISFLALTAFKHQTGLLPYRDHAILPA